MSDYLEVKLQAGESINETKTVSIPELPPKVDVVFCFDLTETMTSILEIAKLETTEIIENLNSLGIDIQYGVTSHMDYPYSYNSYGYSAMYGSGLDYAYMLNQPINNDVPKIMSAINSLIIGNGEDAPECYSRILFESYADSSLGWRDGSKRIFVHFGDNIPHDNNLNEGVPGSSGIWSTGGDPGRDTVMFTKDDLDLQTVLNGMRYNNVILIECRTNDCYFDYWQHWSDITGGSVVVTASSTFALDVTNAIKSALTTPIVSNLHIEITSGFETWLTSVTPISYSGVTGITVYFNITIIVPHGTLNGSYYFNIWVMDDKSISYGEQKVSIQVFSIETPDADPNCIGTSIATIRADRSEKMNGRVYEIIFKAEKLQGEKLLGG